MILQYVPNCLTVQVTKNNIMQSLDWPELCIQNFDTALPSSWIDAAYLKCDTSKPMIASCFVWVYYTDGLQGPYPICSRGVEILSKIAANI